MENKNNTLSWLCINKYLPELDINNIKETLLKSGVTFFNLHRMEKGYFPTSLIKFQVETNKTDLSDLNNKNIKINNRDYIIRKFTEKPRQEYRCRCYTEKPRQQYRYVKPHPLTRYRKETNTAEKTNIEQKKTNIEPKTNDQKTLAEYARRLEILHEQLKELSNQLQDFQLVKKETKKEAEEKYIKLEQEHFWEYTKLLLDENTEFKEQRIDFITRQIQLQLNLNKKITKQTRKIIERCYDHFKLAVIYTPDEFQSYTITESITESPLTTQTEICADNKNKKEITEPDKGP